MKKLLTLVLCFVTLVSFSQKTKTLNVFGTPPSLEIKTTLVKCGTSDYEAIKVTNLTSTKLTISFDVESYWSNNPTVPTTGDEIHKYTIQPYGTIRGNCQNKTLLMWSSGPTTTITLNHLKITNIKTVQ